MTPLRCRFDVALTRSSAATQTRRFGAPRGGGRTEIALALPGTWPADGAGPFLACIARHINGPS